MSLLELTVVMTAFMGILALTLICGAGLKSGAGERGTPREDPAPKRLLPAQIAGLDGKHWRV